MRKSLPNEVRIISILKEHKARTSVTVLCCRHGDEPANVLKFEVD